MTSSSDLIERRSADWLEAIPSRHSRRSYSGAPADPAALDAIEGVCASLRPHPDARVELLRAPAVDVFRGLVGSYGKVTNAPHVLAMIVSDGPHAPQHVGYAGEGTVLEAATLGLSTCWVSGFFSRKKADTMVQLGPNERIAAVSPLGPVGELSGTDRTMSGMAGASRRKPFSEIAEGNADGWPEWARAAVEAARLAPSAMNRQPWRFRMEDGALVVRRDSAAADVRAFAKSLDCGIAMLHAEVAARSCGVPGAWEDSDSSDLDVARYRSGVSS